MSAPNDLLRVKLAVREGFVRSVRIESPRGDVAPIFLGKTPAEAAAMAKLLFSLCPASQSLAVETAGEASLQMHTHRINKCRPPGRCMTH